MLPGGIYREANRLIQADQGIKLKISPDKVGIRSQIFDEGNNYLVSDIVIKKTGPCYPYIKCHFSGLYCIIWSRRYGHGSLHTLEPRDQWVVTLMHAFLDNQIKSRDLGLASIETKGF